MQRLHCVQIQEAANERAIDESSKYLATMKTLLYAEHHTHQTRDYAVAAGYEACKFDLPLLLAQKIVLLDFEARKDSAQVAAQGGWSANVAGSAASLVCRPAHIPHACLVRPCQHRPPWAQDMCFWLYFCCHVAASSCCTKPELCSNAEALQLASHCCAVAACSSLLKPTPALRNRTAGFRVPGAA